MGYLWKIDEALICFERALGFAPNLAEAHQNRGNALKELGRISEAVVAYRRAIELRPNFRDAGERRLRIGYARRRFVRAVVERDHTRSDQKRYQLRPAGEHQPEQGLDPA